MDPQLHLSGLGLEAGTLQPEEYNSTQINYFTTSYPSTGVSENSYFSSSPKNLNSDGENCSTNFSDKHYDQSIQLSFTNIHLLTDSLKMYQSSQFYVPYTNF